MDDSRFKQAYGKAIVEALLARDDNKEQETNWPVKVKRSVIAALPVLNRFKRRSGHFTMMIPSYPGMQIVHLLRILFCPHLTMSTSTLHARPRWIRSEK